MSMLIVAANILVRLMYGASTAGIRRRSQAWLTR
jgi:hypothetical protein